jgi:predicted TIM-barrel fold metal-dependent hydrolase
VIFAEGTRVIDGVINLPYAASSGSLVRLRSSILAVIMLSTGVSKSMSEQRGHTIDGCVFHDWPSPAALLPYLTHGWREVIERPGDRGGLVDPNGSWLYREPSLIQGHPRNAWTFNDFDSLKRSLLDLRRRDRLVLGYSDGLLTTASSYRFLARAVVQAMNDWTAAEWLTRDDRLFGMILVQSSWPEQAAAEIRRVGQNDRMVAVALGANGLGNLFGHPIYRPIYEAAADLQLPLVLQVGGDAASDLNSVPVAGGLPTTFGEYRALSVQAIMTHLASLITEGVFERFSGLKVLVLGGGLTWVAPYLWRLDYWYKTLESEAPWLKKPPSHYFTQHVRLSTYSIETVPTPERLAQALGAFPGFERLLLYASGAPSTEALEPDEVAQRLTGAWHQQVFQQTAEEFFRWPRAGDGPDDDAALVTVGGLT